MTEYDYTRALLALGQWDINNPERVDGPGDQIYVAYEVETALPGKIFTVVMTGAVCTFRFAVALSAPDKTTLDTIVQNHKDNV